MPTVKKGAEERLHFLYRSLVAIQHARSKFEIENHLLQVLKEHLHLEWIRIFYQQAGNLGHYRENVFSMFIVPLYSGDQPAGEIFFARAKTKPFNKSEKDLLTQLGEAISLAVNRLQKLETIENLKVQWEATFDAILDPIAIVDSSYNIIRANQAYADLAEKKLNELPNKKCYAVLFGRDEPCSSCKLGYSFELDERDHVFLFSSQEVPTFHSASQNFLTFYHDITQQKQIERKILGTARMAELGTIGSSIAHDLNNPLGGILSFLQIIKMDISPDHEFFDEVVEMEKAALRCRDIVSNLLNFTRKATADHSQEIDLREVVEQALKITEIQTRSQGLELVRDFPDEPLVINGNFNHLAQVIRLILQRVVEFMETRSPARVKLIATSKEFQVQIIASGTNSVSNLFERPDAGLTVARQILQEHQGKMEYFSPTPVENCVAITFLRPDFQAHGQKIGAQI